MSIDHRGPSQDGEASPRAGSREPEPPSGDLFPTLSTLEAGRENTLENLAQHAVELHDNAIDPVGDIALANFHHEDNSFFTATGEARFGMLDEGGEKRAEGEHENEHNHDHAHADHEHLQAHEQAFQEFGASLEGDAAAAAVANVVEAARNDYRRNNKRRRDEEGVVGPVENGEPIDPIKMKKESHKEVERRRRENINEGIMEIVNQVPGGSDPKVGKGILLKRASDYMNSLKLRVEQFAVELAQKEREKQEFMNELERTRALLEKAEANGQKWQQDFTEASEREARAQFELNEAKERIAELEKAQETKT